MNQNIWSISFLRSAYRRYWWLVTLGLIPIALGDYWNELAPFGSTNQGLGLGPIWSIALRAMLALSCIITSLILTRKKLARRRVEVRLHANVRGGSSGFFNSLDNQLLEYEAEESNATENNALHAPVGEPSQRESANVSSRTPRHREQVKPALRGRFRLGLFYLNAFLFSTLLVLALILSSMFLSDWLTSKLTGSVHENFYWPIIVTVVGSIITQLPSYLGRLFRWSRNFIRHQGQEAFASPALAMSEDEIIRLAADIQNKRRKEHLKSSTERIMFRWESMMSDDPEDTPAAATHPPKRTRRKKRK